MTNTDNNESELFDWDVYDATKDNTLCTNNSNINNTYSSYDTRDDSGNINPNRKGSKHISPQLSLVIGLLLTVGSVILIVLLLNVSKNMTSFNNNSIKAPCTITECERNGTSGSGSKEHYRYYVKFKLNYKGVNYTGSIRKCKRSFDVGSTQTLYFNEDFSKYTLTPQDNFSISLGSKLTCLIFGIAVLIGLKIIWSSLKRIFTCS